MTDIDLLRSLGLFDARVPRYTSYPTAPNFTARAGAAFQVRCLEAVDPAELVSVYIHIPFCERLCWFCACHTQGTRTLAPVESYIAALETELALVARHLPPGVRMGRMHWGGGTPTILPPFLIARLADAVRAAILPAGAFEFSVEIDPTMVDGDKISALAAAGLTRASIGIQDFDAEVQQAIGRIQSFETTRACVEQLRAAGVASLNADLVYGLPHQSEARFADTVEKVLALAPDRVALFGYAHVPWVSKRQKLIDAAALPGDVARWQLSRLAAERLAAAGHLPIGIDHFARPGDGLELAWRAGRLRRNFQGYTDDTCPTLIGLGASSISRFDAGYVQNAPATPAWHAQIAEGRLAGARGHRFSAEDRLRARAIEMLMCGLRLEMTGLRANFGTLAETLGPLRAAVARRYSGVVTEEGEDLVISPEHRALTRLVASAFDAYLEAGGRFSRAS
jgi:oxygen-independent coproporphyrinogen III oxidase